MWFTEIYNDSIISVSDVELKKKSNEVEKRFSQKNK